MPTTTNKDYYGTLGVKKTATPDEIRKAFRKAARRYHPDVNPGDKQAEEKFKEISEANDVLSDEKKRKVYDQVGFYSDQIDPAAAEAYARQSSGRGAPVDFGGFDFSGFQSGPGMHPEQQAGSGSASWGSFKDIFSGIFSGAHEAQRPRGPQPGTDLEYQATVDFWTAIRGGLARLDVHRQEVCPTCHGQASSGGPMQCPECKGTGQVTQMGGRMKFNIPCPALQRNRADDKCLRHLPRRGPGQPQRGGRVSHQGRHARRAADSPARQGQRRGKRRRARRPVSHRPHRHAPGLHAIG